MKHLIASSYKHILRIRNMEYHLGRACPDVLCLQNFATVKKCAESQTLAVYKFRIDTIFNFCFVTA